MPGLLQHLLDLRKPEFWERFLGVIRQPVPRDLPPDPKAAYRAGVQAGYGQGLVDGVDLGMDMGSVSVVTGSSPVAEPSDLVM
jgi:hypothetical protein